MIPISPAENMQSHIRQWFRVISDYVFVLSEHAPTVCSGTNPTSSPLGTGDLMRHCLVALEIWPLGHLEIMSSFS